MGDKFADGWHVVKNAGLGVWDGLTDLVLGILKLLKGVGEVVLWLALQNPVTSYFGLMPEFLEEDMGEMWSGVKQLLKEPGNIVEAIGQSTFDTVDEKGAAYSVSYVAADVVAGVLLDKGLGKLRALGKADDVAGAAGDVAKYTDEVAEAASKAGKHADDVSKAVSESGLDSIIKNGKVSIDDLKASPSLFSGKSVDEIAQALTDAGYDVTVKTSTRSRSGAQIIKINNTGGGKNISQVQISPGGGRHGSSQYVKISTTDQGIIKIIDGSESLYKTDGKETATIIFSGGN